MMHVDATRTLLLSQGYEPIKIISWQRAMTLLTLDKVEVVEEYDTEIRALSLVINVPAVVRLRKAFRRHAKPVKFSRVNIYARDDYRCQYCGTKCSIDQLRRELAAARPGGNPLLRTVLAEVTDGIRSTPEGDLRGLVKGSGLPQPLYNRSPSPCFNPRKIDDSTQTGKEPKEMG